MPWMTDQSEILLPSPENPIQIMSVIWDSFPSVRCWCCFVSSSGLSSVVPDHGCMVVVQFVCFSQVLVVVRGTCMFGDGVCRSCKFSVCADVWNKCWSVWCLLNKCICTPVVMLEAPVLSYG